jgi:hypothetical protein
MTHIIETKEGGEYVLAYFNRFHDGFSILSSTNSVLLFTTFKKQRN